MKQDLNAKYRHLIGKRIEPGCLVLEEILDRTSTDGAYSRLCRARCRCGREVVVNLEQLLRGHNKSCGQCGWKGERVSAAALNNIVGKTFGNLKVIRRVPKPDPNSPKRSAFYECECTYKGCGRHITVREDMIINGNISSCGKCGYLQDRRAGLTERAIPQSDEAALSKRLSGMKQRCYNPNNPGYNDYGGRGITVCEEWRNNTKAFVDWALSHGFRQDLTIDRIDPNGNYCPENCRWIPLDEQSRNTRVCRSVNVCNRSMSIQECASVLKIDPAATRAMSNRELSIKTTREVLHTMFKPMFRRIKT